MKPGIKHLTILETVRILFFDVVFIFTLFSCEGAAGLSQFLCMGTKQQYCVELEGSNQAAMLRRARRRRPSCVELEGRDQAATLRRARK